MSDSPSIPIERPVLLRLGKAFAFLIVPVLVIGGAWEGFKYAKLHLSLSYAQREFSKRQFMRAEYWANRAFNVDQTNVEAARLMAEINEVQDRPAALSWRIRVVQLEPANTGDIMAWAKCALRFEQDEMAIKALKSLPADFQNRSAEFHELMAGFALATHQTGLAESYFSKAAELDPGNPTGRMNLASFRFSNSPNREVREAAARDLEGMLSDSRVRLFAARALLTDAIRNRDRVRAERFAQMLRAFPEHTFSDDLSCLEAVTSLQTFNAALGEIEHRAQSDALKTIATGDWLNAHRMAAETLRWYAKLPEPIQSNIRVQMTEAQSYLAMRDWNGLKTFLEKCRWDVGDYLRHAMVIRCKRELSQPWEKEWEQLMTETEAHPPEDLLLAQLVMGWKWRKEAINLLWKATTRTETESKALQDLCDIFSQTGETSELLRVVKAQLELDPSNPTRKNNEAFLSLLLYGASEGSEILAREVSTANPKIPEWAATYAYALHLAGKESEAKKVMERLSPEALARPDIALYYAIVLAANGDSSKAREFLAKSNPNGMLPEEQKLAADLAQRLNVAVP